jgi:hypothetical protein
MSYAAAYRAGAVRRWHTNHALAGTGDRVDAHSGRVARIILAWHPAPSLALLRAALTHDDGEIGTGDIPAPVKGLMTPDLAQMLDQMESLARFEIWGLDPELTEDEGLWLKLADRLDAYLWALDHGADVDAADWREMRHRIKGLAIRLNVSDKLAEVMAEVLA